MSNQLDFKEIPIEKIDFSNYNNNNQLLGNPLYLTSGICGILLNKSDCNIINSQINLKKSIIALENNKIDIENSNLSTIISNDNNIIYNDNILSGKHARNSFNGNSLYNFPDVKFLSSSIEPQNNSIIDNSILSSWSKPIFNNGSEIKFGKLVDSRLLSNIYIKINDDNNIQISINDNFNNSKNLKYNIQSLINSIPKDLNTYNIIIKIKSSNLASLDFKNFFGGLLTVIIIGDNIPDLTFDNCTNIELKNEKQYNNFLIQIQNCNNILLQSFNFNKINENYNSLLYIKNSKGEIKQCNFIGNTICDGIYFDNSIIYITDCNFNNCIYDVNLINFSRIDTNPKYNNGKYTLNDYYNQITIRENNIENKIDGLYKHLHTSYMPAVSLLPNGSILGYPRIINGQKYIKQYENIKNKYQNFSEISSSISSLILTKAMSNYLPSCYIPFDTDNNEIWKDNYKDKLENISQNYLSTNDIIPINTTDYERAKKYNLYFGTFEYDDIKDAPSYRLNNISFLNNPSATILSAEVEFLSNFNLSAVEGLTYVVNPVENKNGISIQVYNPNHIYIPEDDEKNISCNLNLTNIVYKLVNKGFSITNSEEYAFYLNIIKKSYISFNIDGNKFKFFFNEILDNSINVCNILLKYNILNIKNSTKGLVSTSLGAKVDKGNNNAEQECKITTNYSINDKTSYEEIQTYTIKLKNNTEIDRILKKKEKIATKCNLENIPINFFKNFTNIQIYYFGIPTYLGTNLILGAGSNTDYNSVINDFMLYESLSAQHTYTNLNDDEMKGSLNIILQMPYTKQYYQFYADTILCFYINNLSNDVFIPQYQIINKNNSFTYMVFRKICDALSSANNYVLLSCNLSANTEYDGLYEKDKNSEKYILYYYEEQTDMKYKTNYYIKKIENIWKLYNINLEKNNDDDDIIIATLSNNQPTGNVLINGETHIFYSPAYNNLSTINEKFPNLITNITLEYEKTPSCFMETEKLVNKAYSYIPAYGYNFDFSRYSINSLVSGYFRLLGPNKKYLTRNDNNSKLKLAKIDGFQHNLNLLYNTLIDLQVDIANPMFKYYTSNTQYDIYPFDAAKTLSTTTYSLNSSLIQANALIATANRLTDVLTQRHSNIITDNLKSTPNDIHLSAIYNSNIISSNILNGFGMYYPISKNNKFVDFDKTNIYTNIPYIYDELLNTIFQYKTGGTTYIDFEKYPFCNINKNNNKHFCFNINDELLNTNSMSGQLQFASLPYIYNINNSTFENASKATIKYTGYIQYPYNLTNINYTISYINNNKVIEKTFNKEISATQLNSSLVTGKFNTVKITGLLDGKQEVYIFNIKKSSITNILAIQQKDKFIKKYKKVFSFIQTFELNNTTEIKNFIANYNQSINYICYKLNAIWHQILKYCNNQAAFMTYNILLQNDVFIYGMQKEKYTDNLSSLNNLKTLNDLPSFENIFSIGGTYKCFNSLGSAPTYYTNKSWYNNKYSLKSILSSKF